MISKTSGSHVARLVVVVLIVMGDDELPGWHELVDPANKKK